MFGFQSAQHKPATSAGGTPAPPKDRLRHQLTPSVLFETEEQWQAFRNLPAVRAALDAVPDPVSGLLVYCGRGGGSGARKPRRPKPAPAASAVSLPEPEAEPLLDLTRI
jgi:hypothetical protein